VSKNNSKHGLGKQTCLSNCDTVVTFDSPVLINCLNCLKLIFELSNLKLTVQITYRMQVSDSPTTKNRSPFKISHKISGS